MCVAAKFEMLLSRVQLQETKGSYYSSAKFVET